MKTKRGAFIEVYTLSISFAFLLRLFREFGNYFEPSTYDYLRLTSLSNTVTIHSIFHMVQIITQENPHQRVSNRKMRWREIRK